MSYDPLCFCGHRKSKHYNGRGICYCACKRFSRVAQTTSEKLADYLEASFPVAVLGTPERVRIGSGWKAQGAWVWNARAVRLDNPGREFIIGSTDPMRACIEADHLTWSQPISHYPNMEVHAEVARSQT